MAKDYYATLGLEKSATEDDIKKAFRKLALQYHPDRNPGDKAAEEKFKEINEAYQVLSDPQKKAQYDQFGTADFNGQGFDTSGFNGGFGGFGDIFGDIFGDMFGGGGRSQRTGPARGQDIEYNIDLTFEEAAFGIKKDINIMRHETCTTCHGTGAKPGTSPKTCPQCHGTGQVKIQRSTPLGSFVSVTTCDRCHGEGKIIETPCPDCMGKGKIRKRKVISINIPQGVDTGNTISLRGEGEPGDRGGIPGDLLINIRVRPHRIFRRQGFDITCQVPVSFIRATLGGEIEVPTLEGISKYQVEEGTQPGTVIKLRNKGIPRLRGNGRGDLFAEIKVEIPKKLSQTQKELLQKLAVEFGESPDGGKKPSIINKFKEAFGNQ